MGSHAVPQWPCLQRSCAQLHCLTPPTACPARLFTWSLGSARADQFRTFETTVVGKVPVHQWSLHFWRLHKFESKRRTPLFTLEFLWSVYMSTHLDLCFVETQCASYHPKTQKGARSKKIQLAPRRSIKNGYANLLIFRSKGFEVMLARELSLAPRTIDLSDLSDLCLRKFFDAAGGCAFQSFFMSQSVAIHGTMG